MARASAELGYEPIGEGAGAFTPPSCSDWPNIPRAVIAVIYDQDQQPSLADVSEITAATVAVDPPRELEHRFADFHPDGVDTKADDAAQLTGYGELDLSYIPTAQNDEPEGDDGKVIKITSNRRGFVSTGDVPREEAADEPDDKQPRLRLVSEALNLESVEGHRFSRRRLLAIAATGVLAAGGITTVITDGFGIYGPTKQNIERVKEKQQKFLENFKNKLEGKTPIQP